MGEGKGKKYGRKEEKLVEKERRKRKARKGEVLGEEK